MTLPANVLRTERQRCLGIIAEGARLGVSANVTDAAIRNGTTAEDFTRQNDTSLAIADEIVASAKAAGG
jgi:hypothetical protein